MGTCGWAPRKASRASTGSNSPSSIAETSPPSPTRTSVRCWFTVPADCGSAPVPASRSWRTVTFETVATGALKHAFVRAFAEGRQGRIWVATERGLIAIEGDRVRAFDWRMGLNGRPNPCTGGKPRRSALGGYLERFAAVRRQAISDRAAAKSAIARTGHIAVSGSGRHALDRQRHRRPLSTQRRPRRGSGRAGTIELGDPVPDERSRREPLDRRRRRRPHPLAKG